MKKWLALLLAAMMLLGSTAAVAEIGTAEAPVPVSILIKDVAPDDADTIAVVEAIEKGMAAQGNYVDITILEAPAGKYIEVVPLAFRTGEINPDLIFFQGTYNTSGASHVGIYVGGGMMIHCGNPISYASIETSYWQQHYYCMGRIR